MGNDKEQQKENFLELFNTGPSDLFSYFSRALKPILNLRLPKILGTRSMMTPEEIKEEIPPSVNELMPKAQGFTFLRRLTTSAFSL